MSGNARITQTAKYVPEKIVTNDELSQILETSDEWIYSRTGIKERRITIGETTSDLCSQVAKELLAKGKLVAEDLDFILVATMTPDFQAPSTACLVQGKIGATNAFAMDISAACSGFVFALATAEKLIRSGAYQRGLVIGGETMSKVIDWTDRSTAVVFGDGAAGVLLEDTGERPQFLDELLQSDGSRGMSLTSGKRETTNFLEPKETPAVNYLKMDGREIFDFAMRNVSKNISDIMEANSLLEEELDYILAHQANSRILDSISKRTKVSRKKFLENIAKYGNTSAASVPILLHEAIEEGTLVLGSNQKIVLTGFGGGLTWGSILLSL